MTIIDGLDKIKEALPYPVLTIGNFDGIHRGHQAIFQKLIQRAKEKQGTSVVLTFIPHPLRVIAPERSPKMITTYKDRIRLIEECGIDNIICINFTKEFASITAEDFARQILCNALHVKEIYIGENYRFGKGRRGSPELLTKCGKECGYTVHVVEEIKDGDVTYSSSGIRRLVAKGKVDEAARFLGRPYSVEGIVIEGAKRGKSLLNTPTANMLTANELLPVDGVYAVTVDVDEKRVGGATNIGYNPTFEDKKFSFETHLLDYEGHLVGKTITVHFIKRIRDEIKFESSEALKAQMKKDIKAVREILKDHLD